MLKKKEYVSQYSWMTNKTVKDVWNLFISSTQYKEDAEYIIEGDGENYYVMEIVDLK